jgi:hypothetical protein
VDARRHPDNANTYLISQIMDLSNKYNVQVSGWYQYALESGYDYVYLEYSTNGGTSWSSNYLLRLNGQQSTFENVVVDAPQLANVAQARLRWRLQSDAGVNFDGIHIDDVSVTYVPIVCQPPPTSVNLVGLEGASTPIAPTWAWIALLGVAVVGAGLLGWKLVRRQQ